MHYTICNTRLTIQSMFARDAVVNFYSAPTHRVLYDVAAIKICFVSKPTYAAEIAAGYCLIITKRATIQRKVRHRPHFDEYSSSISRATGLAPFRPVASTERV